MTMPKTLKLRFAATSIPKAGKRSEIIDIVIIPVNQNAYVRHLIFYLNIFRRPKEGHAVKGTSLRVDMCTGHQVLKGG